MAKMKYHKAAAFYPAWNAITLAAGNFRRIQQIFLDSTHLKGISDFLLSVGTDFTQTKVKTAKLTTLIHYDDTDVLAPWRVKIFLARCDPSISFTATNSSHEMRNINAIMEDCFDGPADYEEFVDIFILPKVKGFDDAGIQCFYEEDRFVPEKDITGPVQRWMSDYDRLEKQDKFMLLAMVEGTPERSIAITPVVDIEYINISQQLSRL